MSIWGGLDRPLPQIDVFPQNAMLWAMRVLDINNLRVAVVSYSNRMFRMASDRLSRLANDVLRFVTPVPFCSFNVLRHCVAPFKVNRAPRDP